MDDSSIKKHGYKAASLLFLKEKGLFPKSLLVLDMLVPYSEFEQLLVTHGFSKKLFGIRFSPKKTALCVKSKHGISDLKIGYEFFKNYIHQGSAIIQEHTNPQMMGTLYFGAKHILINLVPGTWATSACDYADILHIQEKIIYYRYLKNRHALYAGKTGFVPKIAQPFSQEKIKRIVDLFQKIVPSLNKIRKENQMLEFMIDDNFNFLAMEMKQADRPIDSFENTSKKDLLTIEKYSDIDLWDTKKDLLIAIKLGRNHPPEFFDLIEKIKQFKNAVYVTYGLLSHPAILLREASIKTLQYNTEYEKEVFSLSSHNI